ncbi:hypothetical protein ACFYTG_50125 [Streptomyces mirabilis]
MAPRWGGAALAPNPRSQLGVQVVYVLLLLAVTAVVIGDIAARP